MGRVVAAGAVLGALAGLIATQVILLSRRAYLPMDPGFIVDERVGTEVGNPVRQAVLGDSTVAGVGSPTASQALPVLIGQRVADVLAPAVIDALAAEGPPASARLPSGT